MKILAIEESPILKVGLLTNDSDQNVEKIIIENRFKKSSLNRVYSGRIVNIVNSLDGAFVDIGLPQNAFIRKKDLLKALNLSNSPEEDLPLNRLVKAGETVIAQVSKEPYQTKGAQLTGDLSIEGMYVVLLPNTPGIKFSKKISDPALRNLLSAKIAELYGQRIGVIVRSSVSTLKNGLEAVIKEIEELTAHWNAIKKRALLEKKIHCLYDSESFYEKIRQWVDLETLDEIRTSSQEAQGVFKSSGIVKKVSEDAFTQYRSLINQLLTDKKAKSPNGASFVMDLLEAFTIVDINSDHQTSTLEKSSHAYSINQELTPLILDRLELLGISGMILIDYINMDKIDQVTFLDQLSKEYFTKDLGYQVHGFTKLGILELSRKRTHASLPHLLSYSQKDTDYVFWQVHELYKSIKQLEKHTLAKALEIEVEDQLYTFLAQNNVLEDIEMKIKLKHRKNNSLPYKFITQ